MNLEKLSTFQLWPELFILLAIMAGIITGGIFRRWRFLFTFAFLEAGKVSINLWYLLRQNAHRLHLLQQEITKTQYTAIHKADYHIFFFTYWPLDALAALAGIGILADLLGQIPLANFAPRLVKATLITFATTTAAACIALSIIGNPAHSFRWTNYAMELYHCTAVLWICFALSLLAGVAACGYGWTTQSLSIAAVFLVQMILRTITSHIIITDPHNAFAISFGYDCLCTAFYAIWLDCLTGNPEPISTLAPLSLPAERLRQHIIKKGQNHP